MIFFSNFFVVYIYHRIMIFVVVVVVVCLFVWNGDDDYEQYTHFFSLKERNLIKPQPNPLPPPLTSPLNPNPNRTLAEETEQSPSSPLAFLVVTGHEIFEHVIIIPYGC